MSLDTISVQRAGLPTFPGLTLRDQLLAGAKQAGDILRTYAQGYRFDPEAANQMLALVNAWQLRNDAELQAALADPSVTRVPDQVKLTFGSDIAQGWIVAGYVQAARTLGPWASGAMDRDVTQGRVTEAWARGDAEARLQTFGAIVKMDQDGYLKSVFNPAPAAGGANGFGLPIPVIVALVVAAVAVLSVVLAYFYSVKRLELNNKILDDRCKQAQAEGDQATVDACIRAATELQGIPGLDTAVKTLTTLAALGLAVWVGVTFIPPLLERRALTRSKESAS